MLLRPGIKVDSREAVIGCQLFAQRNGMLFVQRLPRYGVPAVVPDLEQRGRNADIYLHIRVYGKKRVDQGVGTFREQLFPARAFPILFRLRRIAVVRAEVVYNNIRAKRTRIGVLLTLPICIGIRHAGGIARKPGIEHVIIRSEHFLQVYRVGFVFVVGGIGTLRDTVAHTGKLYHPALGGKFASRNGSVRGIRKALQKLLGTLITAGGVCSVDINIAAANGNAAFVEAVIAFRFRRFGAKLASADNDLVLCGRFGDKPAAKLHAEGAAHPGAKRFRRKTVFGCFGGVRVYNGEIFKQGAVYCGFLLLNCL